MTLRNFDTELDQIGVARVTKVVVSTPVVVEEQVVVSPVSSDYRADEVQQEWDWRGLRDYVTREIGERFGPFPRVPTKEASIFKSFVTRWGPEASRAIAKHAFEVQEGYWAGAPISVNRFCKNSDPFFAQPIVERLGFPTA